MRSARRTDVRHGRAEAMEPGRVRVAGEWLAADHLVLACEAHNAASLLAGRLAELLSGVGYTSSTIVALGYDMASPPARFRLPCSEEGTPPVVACTWVGTKFAHRVPEGKTVARCFVTGDATVEMSRANYRKSPVSARSPVGRAFSAGRIRWRNTAWAMATAWPRFARGSEQPGLHLAGNAYEGIGIPDCIRMGKAAAERILSGN